MRKLATLCCLVLLGVVANAQTINDYLAARKQFGVTTPTSSEALETFVGQRVMEVQGLTKGSIGSSGSYSIILAVPGGQTIMIKAETVPDWLRPANTTARLLVKAERVSETSPLNVELISVTTEHSMGEYEKKLAADAEAKRQAEERRRLANQPTSRGGTTNGRPPSMPGEIPPVRRDPVNNANLTPALLQVLPQYTDFVMSRNSRLSRAKAQDIAVSILGYSAKYGVDARLIMALVMTESNFNPNAVSHAGARGLGQLMPGTARGLGVSNVFDTDQNLAGTVKLLSGHLSKYTNQTGNSFDALVYSLAAYNAGPGAVSRYGGVPPYRETQNYVKKVIATYKQLCGIE